jgi:hypothetical protein
MNEEQREEQSYSVRLSSAQRRGMAKIMPDLNDRLKSEDAGGRLIVLTRSEVRQAIDRAKSALRSQTTTERYALRMLVEVLSDALEAGRGIGAIPPKSRVYQFRIALRHIRPTIWRRVQTRNCTLDRLHEVIQLAMGWTNSHLHEFMLYGVRYGDPMLLEECEFLNSRTTHLVDIVPQSGAHFQFDYIYDFGDHWEHIVEFEECLAAEEGARYPRCVGGENACPPEDIGGTSGFAEYRKIMSNPRGRRYAEYVEWNGPFDPKAFDLEATNRRIKRGLPNWRKELIDAYYQQERERQQQAEP